MVLRRQLLDLESHLAVPVNPTRQIDIEIRSHFVQKFPLPFQKLGFSPETEPFVDRVPDPTLRDEATYCGFFISLHLRSR